MHQITSCLPPTCSPAPPALFFCSTLRSPLSSYLTRYSRCVWIRSVGCLSSQSVNSMCFIHWWHLSTSVRAWHILYPANSSWLNEWELWSDVWSTEAGKATMYREKEEAGLQGEVNRRTRAFSLDPNPFSRMTRLLDCNLLLGLVINCCPFPLS